MNNSLLDCVTYNSSKTYCCLCSLAKCDKAEVVRKLSQDTVDVMWRTEWTSLLYILFQLCWSRTDKMMRQGYRGLGACYTCYKAKLSECIKLEKWVEMVKKKDVKVLLGEGKPPCPFLYRSPGRTNTDMTEQDNREQTNESVGDIMKKGSLMEERRGESHKQRRRHGYKNTHRLRHRHTNRCTHRVAHTTWRWICNCSVFNPAMCLLSRHVRITVPSAHTHAIPHSQREKSLFFLTANHDSPTHQLYLYSLNSYSTPTLQLTQPSCDTHTHTQSRWTDTHFHTVVLGHSVRFCAFIYE